MSLHTHADELMSVLDSAPAADIEQLFDRLADEAISGDLSQHITDHLTGIDTTGKVACAMLGLLNEYRHKTQTILTDATGRLGQLVGCRVTDHAETDDTETLIFCDSKTGKHKTLMINEEGIYLSA